MASPTTFQTCEHIVNSLPLASGIPQERRAAAGAVPIKTILSGMGITKRKIRKSIEQALMGSPYFDLKKRVMRKVRTGQDNLQVIAAERHAFPGLGLIQSEG